MINDDTVYIGLDYGTTRSAVAFRYGNDEIGFWSSWPDMPQDSPSRIKGPTISAYSIGKEGTVPVLAAVGHKAVKLLAEDTNNQLIEIRKPKMKLAEQKMDGIPVLTIVSDYLAELKKGVLQMRAQALPGKNQPTKFRWCLTVPAIWTDDEKRVMRNAATKAGLIEDPEDLLLVLEPEGAVVSFVEYAAKNNIVTENKIVLVVDAGGGTMDLTVHKMSSERLEEVCPGIGNHFGSDTINDKIIEKLKNHFGKNQLFEWKSTKKKLYLKMLLQIENAKCSIKDYKVNSEIDLPNSLGKISIKPTHETGLKIIVDDDDAFKLIITGDAWRDCFKDAIEVTTKMVNELIDKVQKKGTEVNYVWLVGGFSNSRILQNAIIDKCKGRLANSDYVVIPPIPEVSIVAGAIYFGKNPAYIGKRVQRNTIGLEVMEDWDDVKHLGREPWINKLTGKKFCPHVFHCLAKRDQTFEYNSTSEIVTSILYENQRVTNLLFYETVKEDTKYVTDDQQMKLVGQLIVSIPNTNNNADRKVKIEVFYGRGERKAIAYNLSNPNEIYKATLEGANQKARLKYHTIFVIDNSGSMSEKDLSPPPASKFLKNNNRLGAVFEACNAFIGSRIQAASQAPAEFKKNLQNRLSKIIPNASAYNDVNDDVDIYSMIKFNSTAEIVFEKKPLSEQLVDYLTFTPQGGTCYGKALTLVKSLLQPSQSLDSSKRHVPVIIFLSDGEDSGDQNEVMELIENMLVYFPLNMNTVHIGSSNDGKERLAKMAQLGNGCFTPAGSSLDNLLVTFELIAAKL